MLGAMLLIGVLIGRGSGIGDEGAATPQVIRVDAAQGAPAGGGQGAATAARQGGGGQGGKKRAKGKGGTGTGNAPVASDAQLRALQEKTGEEYSEESAKLPNEIATPGVPPPTDGKNPGGGSAGTTIE